MHCFSKARKHDHNKQEDLHNVFSLWPFGKWGMNILGLIASSKGLLGPIPLGKGQVKFLLVGDDYFTK